MRKDLNEYVLAGQIGKELMPLLLQEQELLSVYCDPEKMCGRLFLNIAGFHASEGMENTVIRWLQKIVNELDSFPVQLRRYGGLQACSIFLESASSNDLSAFKTHLSPIDNYIQSYECPPVHVRSHPFVQMTADMNGFEYERTFTNFRLRKFSEQFVLSELLLLRREAGTDEYRQIAVLGLQPLNNSITV
jgi:hypothetical protein